MTNFRQLKIWNDSIEIAFLIYQTTTHFPTEERFGITSQMRRAAVSVSSNIAEGSGRDTDKEKARFLEMSLGSLYELETQLLISERMNYVQSSEKESLLKEIIQLQKGVAAMMNYLRSCGWKTKD